MAAEYVRTTNRNAGHWVRVLKITIRGEGFEISTQGGHAVNRTRAEILAGLVEKVHGRHIGKSRKETY